MKAKIFTSLSFLSVLLLSSCTIPMASSSSSSSTNSSSTSFSSTSVLVENKMKYLVEKDTNDRDLDCYFFQLENASSQTQIGDAIYIKMGSIDIVIDGGEKRIGTDVVVPYLKEHMTDDVLDLVIVTHTDSDHISGMVGLSNKEGILTMDGITVGNLIDSGYEATTNVYKQYATIRENLIQAGTSYYSYTDIFNIDEAPTSFYLGKDCTLKILDTKIYQNNFAASKDVNDYSVPALLTHGSTKFLFTGDLEKKGEEGLLEHNPNLPRVDVFKAGHHGSPTSNSVSLLDKINPLNVIIDSTRNNSYKLPKKEIVDRFVNYTESIFAPFINGGLHVVSNKSYVRITPDGFIDYTTTPPTVLEETKDLIKLQDSNWYLQAV